MVSFLPLVAIIVVHGIGVSQTVSFLGSELQKQNDNRVRVFVPKCNENMFDGIDKSGERLANFIKETLVHYPTIKELNFVSYSCGGLYSRFALKLLEDDNILSSSNVKLGSFITLASPHLSSRQHFRFWGKSMGLFIAKTFFRRTGFQLMLRDGDDTTEPLLVRMTNKEFLVPLKKFKRLIIYSNVQFDHVVHYSTAAIRRSNPFHVLKQASKHRNGFKWLPLQARSSFGNAEVLPDTQPELKLSQNSDSEKPSAEFDYFYDLMHSRLVELNWERFAVTARPIVSHFDIVGMMGCFGKPVVRHVAARLKKNKAISLSFNPSVIKNGSDFISNA